MVERVTEARDTSVEKMDRFFLPLQRAAAFRAVSVCATAVLSLQHCNCKSARARAASVTVRGEAR